jgi:hypothetical protein
VKGFRYLDVGTVARLPVAEIVERVEAVELVGGTPDPVVGAALLGTAQKPAITVGQISLVGIHLSSRGRARRCAGLLLLIG